MDKRFYIKRACNLCRFRHRVSLLSLIVVYIKVNSYRRNVAEVIRANIAWTNLSNVDTTEPPKKEVANKKCMKLAIHHQ
jgi:hypothetical protein